MYNRFFEGKGTPISNRGLEIPIHTGPSADIAWYADGGTLPAGGGQVAKRASVGFKSFALAVQFTGAALDATSKDAVNYARALTFNIKNATVDAIKYLNIYSFLDGTGFLGKVGANITMSTGSNNTVNVTGTIDRARYLRPGMLIDFHDTTTSTVNCYATVVSLTTPIGDATATTVTFGPATNVTTLDLVTGDAFAIRGSYAAVMAGLDLIVDDGTVATTFQGIDRSAEAQYNAGVISLSGSPALARDHLRRAIALIQIYQGSVNTGSLEIWSHPAQLHAYADLGWALKRFQGAGAKTFDAGFTAYEYEGIPWVIDTDAPKDKLYFLDRSSMLKTTARNLSFDDRTGAILRQVPSSTAGRYDDKFVAFLLFRGNLGTYVPNANVKAKGFGVPTGY